MSAQAGWYPDPGGGVGLYRFWDGQAWSAATSPNPAAPPPVPGLGPTSVSGSTQPLSTNGEGLGRSQLGSDASGRGQRGYGPEPYAGYVVPSAKKTPLGWWLGAAALLLVIVVVAAFVIRGVGGGELTEVPIGGGQPSQNACPAEALELESPLPEPNDGRVHGGPLSYPELGSPWGPPQNETRVPFGTDVASQVVSVEPNYNGNNNWVASVLVAELRAGDGFFTPKQGAQVVVKCIIGAFYDNAEVTSDVRVDEASTIDGHEAWVVESQLAFNIPNLRTTGELLIVVIVTTGATAGLYYASIPDTRPELVQPARSALANLQVDD